ncbi:MAG TPA: glycoside hydrolase family 3 C-terminal domain-containing protein, partial [Ohtaekwangia sp.]|uniref:glycoside hydrolase family 3 C-terminal domain-containing protein n=1 Tax=Ohtaekwangia sp. TaxID=2066019 RepID=UPI002F91F2B8
RTKIDLPLAQQELIKEVSALGKPVILVLLNGSALAVNWENDHVAAIVEAWYPGQAAGRAIADVLFGDYNPGGRLPVTFYKSTDQLPAFDDYHITNQTYRYFSDTPLYPFGYGLSYTTFQYSNLTTEKISGDSLRITAQVKNSGNRDGDEVTQVYASSKYTAGKKSPIRSLVAFRRIHLKAGESREVTFKVKLAAIAEPVNISVGGGQPDAHLKTTSNVLTKRISNP